MKCITNIEYFKTLNDNLDIPSEMVVRSKLRDWIKEPTTYKTEILCKNKKSNVKAVKDFIKTFFTPKHQYVSIVVQNKFFKNDTEIIFYKEF